MLGIFRFFSLFLHDLFTLASVFSAFTGVVSWRLLFSAFPLVVEGGVVGEKWRRITRSRNCIRSLVWNLM